MGIWGKIPTLCREGPRVMGLLRKDCRAGRKTLDNDSGEGTKARRMP